MSGPTPPWLRSLIIQYLGILNSLPHLGPAVQDFFPKRRNAPVHCDIHFRPSKNQLRLQQTQRRCGEMADATDLKSVRASSSVWVRIPSSASFEATMDRLQIATRRRLDIRQYRYVSQDGTPTCYSSDSRNSSAGETKRKCRAFCFCADKEARECRNGADRRA